MKSSTTWCQDSEIFLCQHIKIFVLWSWTQSCLYILSYLHVCERLMFTFIHWTNGIRYSIIVNINKQSAGNIISGQFSDTSCRLIFCQITDRIIICIRHDCGGPIIISWGCFSGGLSLLSDPPQLEMRLQQEQNNDGEHDKLWWCWLWCGSARSGDQGCCHHRLHVPALDLLPGLDLQSLVQDTLLWRRGGNQHVEVRWVFGCDSSSRSPNVSPSFRHTLDFKLLIWNVGIC